MLLPNATAKAQEDQAGPLRYFSRSRYTTFYAVLTLLFTQFSPSHPSAVLMILRRLAKTAT